MGFNNHNLSHKTPKHTNDQTKKTYAHKITITKYTNTHSHTKTHKQKQ